MSGERRLAACVEAWPEAEEGMYDPRCCRFPKSCSPYPYPEQVAAGNVELEPTAPVVQGADQPAPDTTAGDALRKGIAAALDDTATGLFMDQSGPGWGDTVARILLGVPEVAQLLADAADGREARAKVQRVRALHNDTRNRGICVECSDDIAVGWPCSTIDALEGKP
jgi:hypothetical protein